MLGKVSTRYWENIFNERAAQPWHRLPRTVADLPYLQAIWMWHLETWAAGALSTAGEWLDSVILESFSALNNSVIPPLMICGLNLLNKNNS